MTRTAGLNLWSPGRHRLGFCGPATVEEVCPLRHDCKTHVGDRGFNAGQFILVRIISESVIFGKILVRDVSSCARKFPVNDDATSTPNPPSERGHLSNRVVIDGTGIAERRRGPRCIFHDHVRSISHLLRLIIRNTRRWRGKILGGSHGLPEMFTGRRIVIRQFRGKWRHGLVDKSFIPSDMLLDVGLNLLLDLAVSGSSNVFQGSKLGTRAGSHRHPELLSESGLVGGHARRQLLLLREW